MRRALVILALAFLATGLVAQTPTQTLENTSLAAVKVQVDRKVVTDKMATKGQITRPVSLHAAIKGTNRWPLAYANMHAGLRAPSRWSKTFIPGAFLSNSGRIYGSDKVIGYAKGFDQNFTWVYKTGKALNGKLKIYFSGYAYGGAEVKAGFTSGPGSARWGNDPTKSGSFYFKKELEVKNQRALEVKFSMAADTKVKKKKVYYSGKLSVYFYPAVTMPELKWTLVAKRNCAKGVLGKRGEVGFGKKFYITLANANDTTRDAVAMLFVGNSDQKFFFIPLPFDLTGVGAPGCWLYVNIHSIRAAKIDNTTFNASVPFTIPGYGYFARYFKPLFFQFAYPVPKTRTNTLGLVFTNYAKIEKK